MAAPAQRQIRRDDDGTARRDDRVLTTQPLNDVLDGLRETPKRLSPVWFYDERGSALFEQICELPEYYPTRTEIGILERHAAEMAHAIGPRACIIEPGSGASVKTRLLLDALERPVVYVPVDVACEQLASAARLLRREYPALIVAPVCADFATPFPTPLFGAARRVVYFPGSTIGNFRLGEAQALLAGFARRAGRAGALLIGVDLRKDPERLVAAYDDAAGVTGEFNKNALAHLNRVLPADFDLDAFSHRAVWNEAASRIEMHLVSQRDQVVRLGTGPASAHVHFAARETLVSEYSHKYTIEAFAQLAGSAGWTLRQAWTDPRPDFSVLLFEPTGSRA